MELPLARVTHDHRSAAEVWPRLKVWLEAQHACAVVSVFCHVVNRGDAFRWPQGALDACREGDIRRRAADHWRDLIPFCTLICTGNAPYEHHMIGWLGGQCAIAVMHSFINMGTLIWQPLQMRNDSVAPRNAVSGSTRVGAQQLHTHASPCFGDRGPCFGDAFYLSNKCTAPGQECYMPTPNHFQQNNRRERGGH
jgi:hypothetical protein